MHNCLCLLALLAAAAGVPAPARAVGPDLILDETGFVRRYYRFATDRISPAALRTEGEKALGAGMMDRLQRETERSMDRAGNDGFAVFRPSARTLLEARRGGTDQALRTTGLRPSDWRDAVFLRMFFDPYTAPPSPADWAEPAFDDSAWVRRRGPFQVDLPEDLPPDKTSGNMATVHVGALQYLGTGMHAAFYRWRFVVDDPARAADLALRLVYRGGARALVNGREIARGHLPGGTLPPETPAQDYPVAAYQNPALRDRTLGSVRIPRDVLVKGTNVLAVEIRASDLHPLVLRKQQSRSWNALHDREGMWRHGYLARLELRGSGAVSGLRRPAGMQVWVADIHHRVESTEFLPPGEPPGSVRLVGVRNGTFGAQVVVGTDRDLTGLAVVPGDLALSTGAGQVPAAAWRVSYLAPFPADAFGDHLGDERGLNARFPDAKTLCDYRTNRDGRRRCVFDQLASAAPAKVPANTCQPVWLSLRIPPEAPAGRYRGTVEVRADGHAATTLPVEVEVIPWELPEPARFQTFVGCEENPYAVARHYGVPLWSDEHFRLLESSLGQVGRVGGTWLNVPVLRSAEFGNREDSMIRWTRRADGALAFDYAVLDRYLDLAVRQMGTPRVINFAVMQGMTGQTGARPQVNVRDERSGRMVPMEMSLKGADRAAAERAWTLFARSLADHLRAKGLERAAHFGYPLDKEEEPDLRALLARVTPQIAWVAGPHQLGAAGFAAPQYRVIGTVRYFNNWPSFRMDFGWKSPVTHLTIPRIDSSVLSLHTASHPFAFRVLVSHSLALGRAGFCRVGADEWAATHYDGMPIPVWIVGMPVLFTLWPGPNGAESSARMEALLEGIQEGEARIVIEQALDGRALPKDLEQRLRDILAGHASETGFFQNKLCIFELEQYSYRWQERSRALYEAAAEVARRSPGPNR